MTVFTPTWPGTNGTNVTSANSGFDFPTTGSVVVATASSPASSNPITGAANGIKLEASTTASAEVRKNVSPTSNQRVAVQVLFYITNVPLTASNDLITIRGTVQNCGLRHHTGGQFRALALGSEIGTGANVTGTTGAAILANMFVDVGNNSGGSNGTLKYNYFLMSDLVTPAQAYSATTLNVGDTDTDTIATVRLGKTTTAADLTSRAVHILYVKIDDDATDLIAPPAATFISDLLASTMQKLDFTGSTGLVPLTSTVTETSTLGLPLIQDPTDDLIWYVTDDPDRSEDLVLHWEVDDAGAGHDEGDLTIPPGGGTTATIYQRELYWDGADLI